MNRNTDHLCPVDQFLEDKEVKFLCGHDEGQMEVKDECLFYNRALFWINDSP